jgi:hypothetical protein
MEKERVLKTCPHRHSDSPIAESLAMTFLPRGRHNGWKKEQDVAVANRW